METTCLFKHVWDQMIESRAAVILLFDQSAVEITESARDSYHKGMLPY